MRYKTLLIDPPYPIQKMGRFKNRRHQRPDNLPYPTMTMEDIANLPIASLADEDAHLWLWTTNSLLPASIDIMHKWGFKYHNTITWAKPSGIGTYFIQRTQFLLFGYRGKLKMNERYKPNIIMANPKRHSYKPEPFHQLIEQVSYPPRIELFARATRPGWTCLGNEIDGQDIRKAICESAK